MRVQRTPEPKGLLEKVKRLPPETLAEVDDFVDFLMHRAARRLTRASRHLLREGKARLRARRCNLSLPDKVRAVIELQRACLPLLARQRPLRPWERVWDVEP